jgi:predicted NAD/FAD-dependent oxidoreductase
MWRVRLQNGEQMYAAALVVAAPAYEAGKLLGGTAAEAAALLSGISYVPTLVLASA